MILENLSWLVWLAGGRPAEAICPVCTVAVGAGLGLSRWLGIDDAISGLWIGGLALSSGLWMGDWLMKKGFKVPWLRVWSVGVMQAAIFIPFYFTDTIGHPLNTLWGVDKLVLGTVVGGGLFLLSLGLDKYLRKMNDGKVLVYYQRVWLPVGLLLLASGGMYLITAGR
jgi:hypothetical protein